MFTRPVRILSVLSVFAGLTLASQAALAAHQTKVGSLRCRVSGGLGLIITSKRNLHCRFTASTGYVEHYTGTIRKFGLDIGATSRGVLAWGVLAPTSGPGRGALAGDYVGAGASATVGAGVGANVLVGGNSNTISLQPLSVQAQTGLNLAAGVSALSLRLAH
jgi:hypothetical protein